MPDVSGKFGKLKIPEGSLIKKIERIKKGTEGSGARGAATLFPQVIEQLRRAPEEITRKIEEMVSSKAQEIKANTEAIKTVESHVIKLEQLVTSSKKGTDEFKERLDKMDETVLELLSLYEVVSSTVNPFVGDKESPIAKKLEGIEKRMEELGQKTTAVPPNLLGDFDNKFKGLENNVEELKKTVQSKTLDEGALVEKVTVQVMERIKPQAKQGTPSLSTNVQSQASLPPASVAQPAAEYMDEDGSGVRLPYLDNRPETSIILLNWIEFLMEKVGRNNLFDVLEYYIEIGWISEEVSAKMMAYANGIDYYVERPTWKLMPEDHTKSLLFIEQLRGRKIDKNLFSRLERDVEKIVRSSEVVTP